MSGKEQTITAPVPLQWFALDGSGWSCCGSRHDEHAVTCPVFAPAEPFVAAMLESIGREYAQWPEAWEHTCFSRFDAGAQSIPQCVCGSTWLLDLIGQDVALLNAWERAFPRRYVAPDGSSMIQIRMRLDRATALALRKERMS